MHPQYPTQGIPAWSLHTPQVICLDPDDPQHEVAWPVEGSAHHGFAGSVNVDYRTEDGRSGLHVFLDPGQVVQVRAGGEPGVAA
jgi:hypothetical protein